MSLILNGDTGISAVDGTAAAPALVGVDTDTGVYFSAANTLDFATAGTRRASINSTGDLQFNSGYGSVATAYGCRAWVNFNGTGTVAIRGSGNVSSITDNGTGDYTVNFTTSMPDANFAVCYGGSYDNNGSSNQTSFTTYNLATGSVRMQTRGMFGGLTAATLYDTLTACVAIFR